ncbi:HNH endonuclease [Burkholderia seminalis]|uniref:HNH endonuclease n=1 Tax=Burkholderia seminalis TaxID=488731 RepID=UPI00264D2C6A|nr:HNH endonuclease signature motif containing protein [Burkholderia seminalis]MDN7586631.1 HNH endonuclease signature motif containing protein [Burkholderia seminalis]
MPQLSRWFDIPNLRTPFLAINLSNPKPESRETNDKLFPKRQTGHWPLTKAVLEHGIEGQTIVLFYSDKGGSRVYVGTCVSKRETGQTKDGKPRYTLTVARPWRSEGHVNVSFSKFFEGFRKSANPTVVWANMKGYISPRGEEVDREAADGERDHQDGEGGYDVLGMFSQRVGHDVFVQRVVDVWGRRCALTDLKAPRLVQACHIVPWRDATPEERTSAHNGLMLCAHLHALFDSHLLGFDTDGHLLLAHGIDASVRALVLAGGRVRLREIPSPRQVEFLRRHRETAHQAGHRLVRV